MQIGSNGPGPQERTTNKVEPAHTMNFRRSDFDVTNRINTTDPVCVQLEVVSI